MNWQISSTKKQEGKMSELDAKMTAESISKSQERAKELQAEIEEKNS
jgi:hypothetical protein